MPNYYIHGGVGTQAGNMEDTGTMVEMESLYLQCVAYNYYRMAGNFRGVLIFVIFVVDLAVTKISTHEN